VIHLVTISNYLTTHGAPNKQATERPLFHIHFNMLVQTSSASAPRLSLPSLRGPPSTSPLGQMRQSAAVFKIRKTGAERRPQPISSGLRAGRFKAPYRHSIACCASCAGSMPEPRARSGGRFMSISDMAHWTVARQSRWDDELKRYSLPQYCNHARPQCAAALMQDQVLGF
jgi:hypothetical protein